MDDVLELMRLYPRVFFACHTRHVRDPQGEQIVGQKQLAVLQHLDRSEPVSVVTLAKHLGVTPATMSASLDRLERLGYLARERNPADRRIVNVRLTERGERITQAESVLDRELVEHLMSRLTAQQRREAIYGLRLLARAAEDTSKLVEQNKEARQASREEKWRS
jgi:MarR family transcriptional regulator, organic hydroperoxide resistance regulator